MRYAAAAFVVFSFLLTRAAASDLSSECLAPLVEKLSSLPANVKLIALGDITAAADDDDPSETIRAVTRELEGSNRFKVVSLENADAILTGSFHRLKPTIWDREGMIITLELTRTSDRALLWCADFHYRRFRRIHFSLGVGATLSSAKFSRTTFDVFERTGPSYSVFSSMATSTEAWPPTVSLRLYLATRSSIFAGLSLLGNIRFISPGGVDGRGGGETPEYLYRGLERRPVALEVSRSSFASLIGYQVRLRPLKFFSLNKDALYLCLGFGVLYYSLNYDLTLGPEYFLDGSEPDGLTESSSFSGFLPGTVMLLSLETTISDHLSFYYDFAEYSGSGGSVPRGDGSGPEMFSYSFNIADNIWYTLGLRVVY